MTETDDMDIIFKDSMSKNMERFCRKVQQYEVVKSCYFDRNTRQIKVDFHKEYNNMEDQNVLNVFMKGGVLEYDKKVGKETVKEYDKIEPIGVY